MNCAWIFVCLFVIVCAEEQFDVNICHSKCIENFNQTEYYDEICRKKCNQHSPDSDEGQRSDEEETTSDILASPSLHCLTTEAFSVAWQPWAGSEKGVYLLELRNRTQDRVRVNTTSSTTFTYTDLEPDTDYQVQIWSVGGPEAGAGSGGRGLGPRLSPWVSTFNTNFVPPPVTNITVDAIQINDGRIEATVKWTPDQYYPSCSYNLVIFYGITYKEYEYRELSRPFEMHLDGLVFGKDVTITIHARNNDEESVKTEWFSPACLEVIGNLSFCAPGMPTGLSAAEVVVQVIPVKHQTFFDVTVQWDRPEHVPDYYKIILSSSLINTLYLNDTVPGNATSYIFKHVEVGLTYMVSLKAFSEGGSSETAVTHRQGTHSTLATTSKFVSVITVVGITAVSVLILFGFGICMFHRRAKRKRYQRRCKYFESATSYIFKHVEVGLTYMVSLKAFSEGGSSETAVTHRQGTHSTLATTSKFVTVITVVGITAVSVLVLFGFGICMFHRRAKRKRYQRRCKYFEELDGKSPKSLDIIGSGTGLIQQEADVWDIPVDRLVLQSVLGEGAFGLVRRAWLRDEQGNKNTEVAVKMLKDAPSSEQIRQFLHEIEIMKTVGPHSHLVSLVGWCQAGGGGGGLMLVVEFCALGDLQNFLCQAWERMTSPHHPPHQLHYADLANNSEGDTNLIINKMYDIDEQSEWSLKGEYAPSSEQIRQFLHEIEIMKTVGPHSHLVSLVGWCQAGGGGGGLMLVVEFCALGDLQNFLRQAWERMTSPHPPPHQLHYADLANNSEGDTNLIINKMYDIDAQNELSLKACDLVSFARQIAVGMEFLAGMKVLHRDLAARNVLVCADKTVKIADFGLSRDVYKENMYKKSSNGKLPIRWMAIESLTHQIYTSQSDVWSFGILLWEIVTLGGNPYPSIPTNALLNYLKSGYRMERPTNCGPELYNVMLSCWKLRPKDRPTFTELRKSMDGLLESITTSKYLDLDMLTSSEFASFRVPFKDTSSLSGKSKSKGSDVLSSDRYVHPILLNNVKNSSGNTDLPIIIK